MNEHGFIRAVHRHLPPDQPYRWKVADRFTRGIPDVWYSGNKDDMWVEYKYLPRVPTRGFKVPLTDHQRKWLSERAAEGRKAAVVVGCPKGAMVLLPGTWEQVTKLIWITTNEVAKWIQGQTLASRSSVTQTT